MIKLNGVDLYINIAKENIGKEVDFINKRCQIKIVKSSLVIWLVQEDYRKS